MSLSGLVLAGGRSRRLGIDKALLVADGLRLVDRAVAVLTEICDDVMVAPGPRRPLPILGTRQVADAVADTGPLGGLVGGLEAAAHELVAVLAVDHPNADPAVLSALAAAWDGEDVVVPEVDGRLQPLHAVWARASAPRLRARLEGSDLSLHGALALLDVRVAGRHVWGRADADGSFSRNLNDPGDL